MTETRITIARIEPGDVLIQGETRRKVTATERRGTLRCLTFADGAREYHGQARKVRVERPEAQS